jgi:hypothetical protein
MYQSTPVVQSSVPDINTVSNTHLEEPENILCALLEDFSIIMKFLHSLIAFVDLVRVVGVDGVLQAAKE